MGADNALDFTAGFSIVNDWIYLDADYVWHEWSLIPVKKGRLPLYYGPGVWTSVSHDAAIGIRGVVGLEYLFPTTPFDVFLEFAPGISVLPSTDLQPFRRDRNALFLLTADGPMPPVRGAWSGHPALPRFLFVTSLFAGKSATWPDFPGGRLFRTKFGRAVREWGA